MEPILPPMPPGVDTGRPCPKYHDGTIKRLAVPAATRRAVALRYGAVPGEVVEIRCQYCPRTALATWPTRRDGQPGAWVHLGLTLDHVHPYSLGGCNRDPNNFVLACKSCNSSKGYRLNWTGAVA